jgi:hypothetical protein
MERCLARLVANWSQYLSQPVAKSFVYIYEQLQATRLPVSDVPTS